MTDDTQQERPSALMGDLMDRLELDDDELAEAACGESFEPQFTTRFADELRDASNKLAHAERLSSVFAPFRKRTKRREGLHALRYARAMYEENNALERMALGYIERMGLGEHFLTTAETTPTLRETNTLTEREFDPGKDPHHNDLLDHLRRKHRRRAEAETERLENHEDDALPFIRFFRVEARVRLLHAMLDAGYRYQAHDDLAEKAGVTDDDLDYHMKQFERLGIAEHRINSRVEYALRLTPLTRALANVSTEMTRAVRSADDSPHTDDADANTSETTGDDTEADDRGAGGVGRMP